MTATNWDITELQGSARRKSREARVKGIVFAAALISVLLSALIIGSLAVEAFNFITQVDLTRLWDRG